MTFERPNIHAMEGYTPGEQPGDGATIKLNTNENPYPPSPAVQAAVCDYDTGALRTYPPPTADPLRDALARLHGVGRENIVITHGGDEGLRLAMTTFVEPRSVFGMATPSYSLYSVLAEVQDASIYPVSLDDDFNYPDDFAQRLNAAGACLTCIVNPHAPSGRLLPPESLAQLARALDKVLLIDEAYVDFVDPSLKHDAVRLIDAHDNVLLLRTFSKGYSLAGLRLGYLIGPENLIGPIVSKTRDSYNVDHISQTIGLAAISDWDYAERTWEAVRDARDTLTIALEGFGFGVEPSQTNFLLARTAREHPLTAAALYQALKQRGILVRYFNVRMMQDRLRITIGTPEQNSALIAALEELLS